MDNYQSIRSAFRKKLADNDVESNGTLELRGISFIGRQEPIFGKRNEAYQEAEMKWYKNANRCVHKLYEYYGKEVAIWKNCADRFGEVNSNYGWCIQSPERNYQYKHVLETLDMDPDSRQAIMIYTHPDMHKIAHRNGMHDFTCTNTVQYFIRNGYLETYVHMRSNDAIFGYIYDYPWQEWVAQRLSLDLQRRGLKAERGPIQWSVGSFHIYPRHFHLIKEENND